MSRWIAWIVSVLGQRMPHWFDSAVEVADRERITKEQTLMRARLWALEREAEIIGRRRLR